MSDSKYQKVNQIQKEITDLQKKIANETKKEFVESTKILQRMGKYRELSNKNSQKSILHSKEKIVSYQEKIATKLRELEEERQELQKVEQNQLSSQRDLQLAMNEQKEQLDYLINQNYSANQPVIADNTAITDKEFDFFISHASEDKHDFVRKLAEALKAESLVVWYDEFELKIGDSLRKKIDNGLSKSKYGIVIVSQYFISKNWTEYELNGMVAREMNGHKVILPIWHKISKNEVLKYSPTLADKMALNTSIHTIDDIVRELKGLL